MNITTFVVELYVIFLGITLTASIERIVERFSYFSAACFVLIFFLAINFFFAKIKDLSDQKEKTTGASMVLNLLVVCCFSFMPYFMDSFVGIMVVLLLLRVFDALLILEHAKWKYRDIDAQEKRWIRFDISYFIIELVFIAIYCLVPYPLVPEILITIYLVLGIFESVFDFVVNSKKYFEDEDENLSTGEQDDERDR